VTHLVPIGGDWALWRTCAVRGAGLPFRWLDWFAGPDGDGPARMLTEPSFLTALTWQNPHVVRAWAGQPQPRINGVRARLAARYAQRYCAKNDSIGFFGSVGWGELAGHDSPRLSVQGGCGVRRGDAYFEHWAIEELARAWERDRRLAPHLPVRWHPAVTYDGHTVRRPCRPPLPVDPQARRILARVDGRALAGEVAGECGIAALMRLHAAGVLCVGFVVPVGERPEDHLRAQAAAIPDAALRDELCRALDRLEACRAAIAAAAYQPRDLCVALGRLDHEFNVLTGRPPTRDKSGAGAGRTLVYLDCRRDLDIEVPGPLIEGLREPLRLLLQSARWFTEQVAEAVEDALDAEYRRLAARGGEVCLSDLHFASAGVLSGAPGTPVHDVADDFRERWREVLSRAAATTDEISISSEQAAPLVDALFPGRRAGWAAARYHSPDLMLAREPDGYRWIVGELHLAMNTLDARFFHTLSDRAGAMAAATASDMAGGRIVPCYPPGREMVDSRRYPPLAVHVPDRYLYWSFGDDTGAPAGSSSWPATALRVRHGPEGLVAGPADGCWELPVREFFGEFLSALVVNSFRIPGQGHRVVIDDLVVRRRTWHFSDADLPEGVAGRGGYKTEALAARLAAAGLPRYLFAKTPQEPKPFFVDLQAPLMLANLARAWRQLPPAGRMELQEMLPGPEHLWLADDRGRLYTCELRLVAVDRAAPGVPVPDAAGAQAD
jgi:lantibiotic biosynthesis dehydratase-like protein